MTIKEHNQQIRAAYKKFELAENKSELSSELNRLYNADTSGSGLTLQTLKMMIRMNHSLRVVPLHSFYISMNP